MDRQTDSAGQKPAGLSGKTGWRMKPSQDTCCRCRQETLFGGNSGDVNESAGAFSHLCGENVPFALPVHGMPGVPVYLYGQLC